MIESQPRIILPVESLFFTVPTLLFRPNGCPHLGQVDAIDEHRFSQTGQVDWICHI